MSLRNKFKKDISKNTNLSFDVSQLKSNETISKSRVKIYTKRIIMLSLLVPLSVIIIAPLVFILATMKTSTKDVRRKYTINEIQKMENSSFKALNKIPYPTSKALNQIDIKDVRTYDLYVNNIYRKFEKESNMMFSPLTLYGFFVDSYGALSDEEMMSKYESLLGLGIEEIDDFYRLVFTNNFFATNNGTVQLHNGVFIDNQYHINPEYVSYLNKVYTECFSMSFKNTEDIERMVDWIGESVGDKRFLTQNDIPITNYTTAYMFSTLKFDMKWAFKYVKAKTYSGDFFGEGSTIKTKYMKHTFMNVYYDYGSYISVVDRYCDGYSITYLVPKKTKDSIYELTKDTNIFIEDDEKKIDYKAIELHVPKFSVTKTLDFKNLFNNLGLGKLFSMSSKTLNNLYTGLTDDTSLFLETVKQKNLIQMNEDGTQIKSVDIGGIGATSSANIERNAIEVKLNQPFIYIVKDANNLPIYVGHIDDPNSH